MPAESPLADVALAIAFLTVLTLVVIAMFRDRRSVPANDDEVPGDYPFDQYLHARKAEKRP